MRKVNNSSNQKPNESSPTNAPIIAATQAAAKQPHAISSSVLAGRPKRADGRGSLSIKDKVEFLAHVLALERLAQTPEPRVEHEMRHDGSDESTVDRVSIGEIRPGGRADSRIEREGAQHAETQE